eukprot:SAG22_NODE_38_length_26325_cov_107.302067_13_plen_133_part_00
MPFLAVCPPACLPALPGGHEQQTLRGLEDAPNLWAYVKKQNYTAKERLMPLQNAEAERIKVEVETFNKEVQTFRDALKANAPFDYSSKWEESFATLRRLHTELAAMEKRAKYLNEMQVRRSAACSCKPSPCY